MLELRRADPTAESSAQAGRRFRRSLARFALLVAFLWLLLALDALSGLDLRGLGVRPGTPTGLSGLVFMPLLHGGVAHLAANSLPLLTLGTALLFFYPTAGPRALPWMWTLPGLVVWLIGSPGSTHFGASGLNFALLGFLLLGGLLRREAGSLAVSLAVMFYYGGMLSGVLPVEPGVSWESHLGGLAVGLTLAVIHRNRDIPAVRRYSWEDDEEEQGGKDEECDAPERPGSG